MAKDATFWFPGSRDLNGTFVSTRRGADRFEGQLEDVFELQDHVTSSVIGAVAPKLEQAEIERGRSAVSGGK